MPPEYGPLNETLQTTGMSFTPHQIHGNAGQKVTLTVVGSNTGHTFTVPSLGVDVSIPAGQTRTAQFVVPGESILPFFCRIHGAPDSGMHGQLVFH